MKANSFSIVIPIYNEEEILEKQVKKLISEVDRVLPNSEYELVLVENGSTDNTLAVAKKLSNEISHINVVHLDNPSYGQAFKEGVREAKYDIVVQFDIDFWDTDFLDISLLLLGRYDFVIGSKNLGTSRDKRPLTRKILSKFLEVFLKYYFNVPFSDTHGIKAMKRKLILPFIDDVQSENHFFDSELLIMCHYQRYSFKELPVSLEEIRATRFSFLVRTMQTIREFVGLITVKKLLVRYAYL